MQEGRYEKLFCAVKMLDAVVSGRIPVILILFIAAVIIDYMTGWIKAKYFFKGLQKSKL